MEGFSQREGLGAGIALDTANQTASTLDPSRWSKWSAWSERAVRLTRQPRCSSYQVPIKALVPTTENTGEIIKHTMTARDCLLSL